MNLKNITLKAAELGPVEWENVKKLQPSENGYIFFVEYSVIEKTDMEGNTEEHLQGKYIQTNFDYEPTYKEIINFIVSSEYPNGKEQELLRYGISDSTNEEYIEYYNNVESIIHDVK